MEPAVAVDGQGRVYVTDPEGYRIIVFDGEGELVATFGLYGLDTGSFTLPTDVEVDGDGNIYVTDTDGQRVMRFAPLP
jgi:tripartite motif-containing protein 71